MIFNRSKHIVLTTNWGKVESFLVLDDTCDLMLSASFSVYKVNEWDSTGEPALSNTALYVSGLVKWDGCAHFWFGQDDGYLHFCGKSDIELHERIMSLIWHYCRENINGFDESVAER